MRKNRFSLMAILSILLIGAFILGACAQVTPTEAPVEPVEEPVEEPAEAALGTEENPIVWVLTPSQDTQAVLTGAEGLTQFIEDETGIVIQSFVATDYTAQVEAICSGEAQMAALNTFGYIRATERDCAEVAVVSVRFGSTSYSGQLITQAGSGIESVEDLAGKVFCRPDPGSTSGWIIPSLSMLAAGIDPETDLAEIVDAGGHDAVVITVYNGECDAGSTFVDARDNVADEEAFADVYEKVVVLTESPPIPNDNISFAPEVPEATRQAIVDALLKLNDSEEGQTLLNELYSWSGLEAAEDTFYDGFRQQLEAAGMSIEDLVN
ncbi:MAG: phosphate/phosphite/phosphonate ABC transporter substrate-binding protein [Anaerolineales bacterium]|nr:phosphate/phosphite/phosphonate ABC transporter substrate-binding protein [Anaerolineales bacterium]